MRKLLVLTGILGVVAGCQPAEVEVVVTRDQFGDAWPLQVNSAKVLCAGAGEAAYLRLGRKLYGLNAAAEAEGLPSANEVVRQIPVDPANPAVGSWPADLAPLAEACDRAPGNVASR